MKIYNLKSTIDVGEYAGLTVAEVLEKNKKSIFQMIKEHKLYFNDEVLELAGITKVIREHKPGIEWEKHESKSNKKLKKDTKNLDEIMDELEEDRHKLVFEEEINEDLDILENSEHSNEVIEEYGNDPIIIDTNLENI